MGGKARALSRVVGSLHIAMAERAATPAPPAMER